MIVTGNVRRVLLRFSFVLAVLALAALAGCSASTVVPLRYQPSTPAKGAVACRSMVTLLPFADKRANTLSIGTLDGGKRFYAENDPAEWISWAMFEELKARNCDVQYRESGSRKGLTGYVVSGSFDTLDVQSGTALMARGNLRITVRLEKNGKFVYEHTYTGERENLGLTKVDAAQKVLSSTLQYLLKDAAADVARAAK